MYDLDPPALYAHESVLAREADRERMLRVVQACGRTMDDVLVYADDQLYDLIEKRGFRSARRRMGTLAEVHDPALLFNTFRFDGRAPEAREALAERFSGFRGHLADALLGYGAFDWFCAGLKDDPHRNDKVCRPCWRLHFQQGCVHRCRYCGEGGLLVTMTNVEDYIQQLDKVIAAHPWQETYLLEDDADIPCLEPELGCLGPIIEYFGTVEDRYLIIHTKTWNTDWMRSLDHRGHTIVVWSLTSHTVSREIEPKSGTTEQRIEAARRLQEAGYTIRYKFKPIVPVRNWRQEATDMIELALTRTNPDNLSLFSFAWCTVDQMKEMLDVEMLDPSFVRAAEESVEAVAHTLAKPFPEHKRAELYEHYLAEIKRWNPEVPVCLSTETWDMWKRFKDRLGMTPTNYVCGCGPQAVPWRRKLDVNPFAVARRVPVDTGDDGPGVYGH